VQRLAVLGWVRSYSQRTGDRRHGGALGMQRACSDPAATRRDEAAIPTWLLRRWRSGKERTREERLRTGTRRGRAGLARRAPGSLRVAIRDGRETAARRDCWAARRPEGSPRQGRAHLAGPSGRDALQGGSVEGERENGEGERGRGELTSTARQLRARRGSGDGPRRGRDEGRRWWAKNYAKIPDGSVLETSWARKTVQSRFGEEKQCSLRPGAWGPLGGGGSRRAVRFSSRGRARARNARGWAAARWACWPLGRAQAGGRARWAGSAGLAEGGLAGARLGWRARGPTRRELARVGRGGERGEERSAGGPAEMGQGRGLG
jgi:hypothetical protein